MKKKVIGIVIAAILIVAANFIAPPTGLTREGLIAIACFLSAVVMWICESLPMSVTGLGLAMLLVLFRVYTINDAYRTFAGTAFFFVFATYAINACLASTSIPDRICAIFIRIAKGNSKVFVFGIMFAAMMLSSIMSNMATCALLATLCVKILEMNGSDKNSNLGKCLMIGIPYACGAGGFATPAGTPANVIAINLLEENLGITLSFLDWTLIGFPVAILSVIVTGLCITTIFKPEKLSEKTISYANNLSSEYGKLSKKEIKILVILLIEIGLWLAGTWISILSTTLVAIICMALMFMPGINVLDWKTYDKYANYDCLFMMGSITALVGGLSMSGATQWLVDTVIPDMSGYSVFVVYLLCSALVAILHMLIPAGSAVLTLAAVPMIGIAAATGISGAHLMLIASFWAGAAFLLPFDGVPLLTYGFGYYKMTDMIKAGIIPYLVLIPLIALVVPLISKVFGF